MRSYSSVRVSLIRVKDHRLPLPSARSRNRATPELDEVTDWRVVLISLPAVVAVCYMLLFP